MKINRFVNAIEQWDFYEQSIGLQCSVGYIIIILLGNGCHKMMKLSYLLDPKPNDDIHA